jgi:hypothetical protein
MLIRHGVLLLMLLGVWHALSGYLPSPQASHVTMAQARAMIENHADNNDHPAVALNRACTSDDCMAGDENDDDTDGDAALMMPSSPVVLLAHTRAVAPMTGMPSLHTAPASAPLRPPRRV